MSFDPKWAQFAAPSVAARPATAAAAPSAAPAGFSNPRLHVIQALYGDAILLDFEVNGERKVWLIDGGPGNSDMPFNSREINSGSMFHRLFDTLNSTALNIPKLDNLIITHRDYDHLHGIVLLLASLVPSKEIEVMQGLSVRLLKEKGSKKNSGKGGDDGGSSSSSSSSAALVAPCSGILRWERGFALWNQETNPIFPIDRIWYNDILVRAKWVAKGQLQPARKAKSKAPKIELGWMETLLLGFYRTMLQRTGRKIDVEEFEVPPTDATGTPFILNRDFANNIVVKAKESGVPANITNGAFNIQLVGPHQDILERAGPTGGTRNIDFERLSRSFHSNVYAKAFTTMEELAQAFWATETINASVESRTGENACSIMFEIGGSASSGRMIFTGDGTGWDIDKTYEYPPLPDRTGKVGSIMDQTPRFEIMKVAHHGSQRNNTLNASAGEFDKHIIPFFKIYNATTYVISSHPILKPNPDSAVLRAIVKAHKDLHLPRPIIYMTNGCSPIGIRALTFGLPPRHKALAYFLKPGLSYGTVVPGTTPSGGADDHWNLIDHVNATYAQYFKEYLTAIYPTLSDTDYEDAAKKMEDASLALEMGKSTFAVQEVDKFLAKMDAKTLSVTASKSTKPMRSTSIKSAFVDPSKPVKTLDSKARSLLQQRTKRTWPDEFDMKHSNAKLPQMPEGDNEGNDGELDPTPGPAPDQQAEDEDDDIPPTRVASLNEGRTNRSPKKRRTDGQSGELDSADTEDATADTDERSPSPSLGTKRTLARASPASVTTAPPSKHVDFHDLMLSGNFEQIITGDSDLDAVPTVNDPANNLGRATQGVPCKWVDLTAFITYVTQPGLGLDLDDTYKSYLKRLFTTSDHSTRIVLLSTLLGLIFSAGLASDFLCQLPINGNGKSVYFVNKDQVNNATLFNLSVLNFRAAIPTVTTSSKIVAAIWFQLAEPPPDLWPAPLTRSDALFWTLPYQTQSWQPGWITLTHTQPLTVKIVAPFFENRAVTVRFRGDLNFGRVAGTAPLHVLGKMVACGSEPSAYDLRLIDETKAEPTAVPFKPFDLLGIFAPLSLASDNLFKSVFGNTLAQLTIPGLDDITKLASQTVKLKDGGIILKQVSNGVIAVDVQDIYGEIDVGEALDGMFAAIGKAIGLTGSVSIPGSPSLIITLRNITHIGTNDVSFTFEYPIDGLGDVAVEIGTGSNGLTQFDFWLVCEDGVSFGTLLNHALAAVFGFAADADSFRAARLFVTALDNVTLPYLRLTFAETSSQTHTIELVSYGFVLDVDPIDIGPITLNSFSLALVKVGGTRQEINAYGTALIDFGADVDAVVSFTVDHQADDIQALISNVDLDTVKQAVQLNVSFPDKRPSILTILHAIMPDDLLNLPIWDAIPASFAWILDGVAFNTISLGLISDDGKSGWRLATFFLEMDLAVLSGNFSFLGAHFDFGVPTFALMVTEPTDSKKRSISAQVAGTMTVNDCVCDLTLTMLDTHSNPSNDGQPMSSSSSSATPSCFSLGVGINVSHGSLLFVAAFEHFLEDVVGPDASNAIDSIVGPFVPDVIADQLRSVALDKLLLRIVDKGNAADPKSTSHYAIQHFEALIASTLTQWKPWDALDSFSLDEIYLRVVYDTGEVIGPGNKTTPANAIAFDFGCVANFGSGRSLNANITYQRLMTDKTSSQWALTLTETVNSDLFTLKLGDLIAGAATSIGFDLPQAIHDSLDSLLTLAPQSLMVSYSETARGKAVSFSQEGGHTDIMGCQLTSINIICEKSSTAGWSWTIALAASDAVNPLSKISSVFNVVELKNAHVAFWHGTPSSSIPNAEGLGSSPTGNDFMLAGTLVLHDNPFLEVVKGFMLGAPEIDFMVTSSIFRVDKKVSSSGFVFVPFLEVFTLQAFHFTADGTGFAVGGTARLDASWLSKDTSDPNNPRPIVQFEVIVHDDGGIGVDIKVTELDEPFGIPGLEVEKLHVAVAVLAEGGQLESLTIQGTFTLKGQDQVDRDKNARAAIDLVYSTTAPQTDHIYLDIANLSILTVAKALAGSSFPSNSSLNKIGELVYLESLHLKLEPKAGAFSFDASLKIFGLHGSVVVDVNPDPTSMSPGPGVTIGAHLDQIQVLDVIKIRSHTDGSNAGPYMYINTRLGDQSTQTSLLNIDSDEDAVRANSPFIVSGKLQFLTITWDIFGRVSTKQGLELIIGETEAINVPGLDLKTTDTTKIEFDKDGFTLTDEWILAVNVSVPNLSWLPFGAVDIPGFDANVVISCSVPTPDGDWMHDGIVFQVEVEAHVPIIGHIGPTTITLPISISSLSDIPGIIEKFFEDQVLDFLKKLADPFEKAFEVTRDFVEKQAKVFVEDLNMAEHAAVSAILSGYHDTVEGLSIAASVVADTFNYGVNELCSAMSAVGYTASAIASAVGDALDASAQDIASGLVSAGFTIEHAFESAFGEGMGAVGKEFGLIGSTIASGIDESVGKVEGFFVNDVESIAVELGDEVKDWGGTAVNAIKGGFNDVGNFFTSLF